MAKVRHELRDGIYGFIHFNNQEKKLIDSAPFQRLRSIHQLAMCYQVYPGATHRRFEHSLGVMEVATRIFDGLFSENGRYLREEVKERLAETLQPEKLSYWRQIVRFAALLHDIGHLPFSHAAEEEMLPPGINHEFLTVQMIRESEIADILRSDRPMYDPEDVIDVVWSLDKRAKAVKTGQEKAKVISPWATLLNEIITGNTFGADRIDYLLRDSWHAGVAYGKFDPERLVSGLRAVLNESEEITLALDISGIHSAEALLLARYFMYSQVYFHDVRRIYDQHLKDFLKAWLPEGKLPNGWQGLLHITDNEVLAAMNAASLDPNSAHHTLACRLTKRQHFRTVYELVASHKRKNPGILEEVYLYAQNEFGDDAVRFDRYGPKTENNDFLVQTEDGSIQSSLDVSQVIAQVPPFEVGLIFVAPEIKAKAKRKIDDKVSELLNITTV